MTDVFISYSRKDKLFVQRLHEGIVAEGRDAWVDWEGIPLTADWWAEIRAGIEAANAFVFVISPDSAASTVCGQELDHAHKHNKRIVPIVYRDVAPKALPPLLGKLNWVFFRDSDDFDGAFKALLASMDTDYDWVKAHTRLIRRAVEWDKHSADASYLLRGTDLKDAEQRLTDEDKEPALTNLQIQYILSSRQYEETERQKEAEAREQSRIARRRIVLIGLSLVMTILIVLLNYGTTRPAADDIGTMEDLRFPASLTAIRAQKNLLLLLDDVGGYLFLGDERYQESYRQNKLSFEEDLAQLEAFSHDQNFDNQHRIDELKAIFEDWRGEADHILALSGEALEEDPAFHLSKIEPQVMKMQQLLAEITNEQQQLLYTNLEASRTSLDIATNQSLVIGLIVSILGLSIIWIEIHGLPPKDRWQNLLGLRKKLTNSNQD